MMKKLLLFLMMLAFALPAAIAGEKTIVINRNEGIYEDGNGVYYCTKGGITMTFSSGLNNVNYLVEHQQVVFDIFSTNYVIKKIKFNCLDNTTNDNLDCFYWGPSTIHELGQVATYTPTGTYTYSGYIGTWVGGSTPSKYIKFVTEGKPVRFGSVEITIDKDLGDIFDLVTSMNQIEVGQKYVIVSQRASKAMSTHTVDGLSENNIPKTTMGSTSVSFVDDTKQKVIVNEDVMILSLESNPSSVSNTMRPYLFKYGNQYLRRNSATSGSNTNADNYTYGHNLSLASYETATDKMYFPFDISLGTNSNAMMSFIQRGATMESESTSGSYSIRYHNGSDFFRVLNWSTNYNTYAANQRVYLYRPAQNYVITTQCLPDDNSGYITLGDGVLELNGQQTSQQYQNVNFFVGPTEGWGIGAVTVTNLSTNEVTTLTPTATSDFGNDYQFPMPGANVSVTANFLQPFNIDTICNPSDGGQFNFINGYTNFSGQYYSNEGKTVTFKPTAAEGYIFNSVTYTDNVTGETTTLTPDADGVYSFVMPGNDVTLTANFEEAHDLYLLGTANGRTSWIPSGPKFTFDGQKYYIDVYFKGGNDDPNTDPAYGYFSLTKKIDEGGNWNIIREYRLAAENNNTWVADGYTGVALYGDRPENAFKIKTGVYRIEVNSEMTEMSITEYPLTLTFNPAGGVPGNATVVEPNTEVTISSNLQDLVHAINPNEDNVLFYNTIDNWATQENDNTREISAIGETTVTASATLGQYLIVPGSATYEIPGDLYLLGTVNGETVWYPHGPKFTYDETNQEYYIDVYFKGDPTFDNNQGDPYGHFSLSTKISASDDGWEDIEGYRLFATQRDYWVEDGTIANDCFQTETDQAFKIPAGVYRITVNKAKTQMTITEYPLTLTFDPVSGSTVAAGETVSISSNLDQLVHGINANEDNATFTYATSTDGSLPTPDTAGSTVNITAQGATTTVNAQANIGYIVAPGNAYYTVPAPEVYDIFTIVDPEEAGTITAPSGDIAGATVNFTVTDADPSLFTLLGVEVVDGNNAIVETFEPSADGNYSFTMPDDEVTIYADYVRTPYNVTTSWSPSEGGAIWLNGVNTPQTVSVPNADQVVFGVAPADGYVLTSFTVTNTATGQEITPTPTGISNEYTFTMPAGNVIIMANFLVKYNIITQCTPPEGGSIDNVVSSAAAGETVTFTVTPNIGWTLTGLTVTGDSGGDVTVTDNGNGSYSFTMPEANVTVTANYGLTGVIFKIVTDPSEIVEGVYYTIVNQRYDRVLNNIAPGAATNFYSSTNIVEWASEDKSFVKLDGNACFFSPEDVTDYNPTSYTLYRSGYLKTSGGYIGREPNVENNEYGHLALFGSKDNVKPFYMSVDTYGAGSSDHWAYIHYDFDSNSGGSVYDSWAVFFDKFEDNTYFEYNSFLLENTTLTHYDTWLYKPAKMYNITTVVNPDGTSSSLELDGGVVGNTGAEGSTIVVRPVAAEGEALYSLEVTVDDTGDVVEVTPNVDGSYTFVMPSNDVTITATFTTGYHINWVCDPEETGEIIVTPTAYAGQHVAFEVLPYEDYEVSGITITIDGDDDEIPYEENEDGTYSFYMPAGHVTITATLVLHSEEATLQYIEQWDTYYSGTRVTVNDELIGAWRAKQYLWVKDQAPQRSNVSLDMTTSEETFDFLRECIRRDVSLNGDQSKLIMWQPREWDQSNWAMLDFSKLFPKDAEPDEFGEYQSWSQVRYNEMRDAMQQFVDNKIAAGSITGTYYCKGEPDENWGDLFSYPKVQHVIVLDKLPDVIVPVTTAETSLGYPGYVKDPKEVTNYPDPSKYMYNHYMSYNFYSGNISASGKLLPEGEVLEYWCDLFADYDQNTRYFFMNPKDQEVAQVCGVYLGKIDDKVTEVTLSAGEMDFTSGDLFGSYKFDPENGINHYGWTGTFLVPNEGGINDWSDWNYDNGWSCNGWQFNRLKYPVDNEYNLEESYGRPGAGELVRGEGYIFHAVIQYTPTEPGEPVNAPRRENQRQGTPNYTVPPEYYLVYPLDMMSRDDNFTHVKEVKSQEASLIKSITYYNLMGQESKTPFEGINIEVIRYQDGSMISRKILR